MNMSGTRKEGGKKISSQNTDKRQKKEKTGCSKGLDEDLGGPEMREEGTGKGNQPAALWNGRVGMRRQRGESF